MLCYCFLGEPNQSTITRDSRIIFSSSTSLELMTEGKYNVDHSQQTAKNSITVDCTIQFPQEHPVISNKLNCILSSKVELKIMLIL